LEINAVSGISRIMPPSPKNSTVRSAASPRLKATASKDTEVYSSSQSVDPSASWTSTRASRAVSSRSPGINGMLITASALSVWETDLTVA